jgi:hypothetical protein
MARRHHLDATDTELLDWWVDEFGTTRGGFWFEQELNVEIKRYTTNAHNKHVTMLELRMLAKPESMGGAGLLDKMRRLITQTRLDTHANLAASNASRRLEFAKRLATQRQQHLQDHRREALQYVLTDCMLDAQVDECLQTIVSLEHVTFDGNPEESIADRNRWRDHLRTTYGLTYEASSSDFLDSDDDSDDYPQSMLDESPAR